MWTHFGGISFTKKFSKVPRWCSGQGFGAANILPLKSTFSQPGQRRGFRFTIIVKHFKKYSWWYSCLDHLRAEVEVSFPFISFCVVWILCMYYQLKIFFLLNSEHLRLRDQMELQVANSHSYLKITPIITWEFKGQSWLHTSSKIWFQFKSSEAQSYRGQLEKINLLQWWARGDLMAWAQWLIERTTDGESK